jgi:hypothetical protein
MLCFTLHVAQNKAKSLDLKIENHKKWHLFIKNSSKILLIIFFAEKLPY